MFWGYQNPIATRTVDTHIRRLRENLASTLKGWKQSAAKAIASPPSWKASPPMGSAEKVRH